MTFLFNRVVLFDGKLAKTWKLVEIVLYVLELAASQSLFDLSKYLLSVGQVVVSLAAVFLEMAVQQIPWSVFYHVIMLFALLNVFHFRE